MFSFKISFVDSEEKTANSETHDYFADDLKKGELSMRLDTKKLMGKGVEMNFEMINYLEITNDVLSLDCEYVRPSKTALFEFFVYGSISSKLTNEVVENKNEHYAGKEKSQNISDMVGNLKYMDIDAILYDTELRTSTHTFTAHKIILSIGSPVFSRMFSNDMKEKNSGHVEKPISKRTPYAMLLYMYMDSLEDLHFESASKLYAAADKYQIPSLKSKCSCLTENLCPAEVCDVLILAGLHQDNNLKSFAENYILNHDKEVFGSQEWKDFMDAKS
ncbi:hypothetical protein AVEN_269020-1 [Araneus ventricosus]|uniref:BTB domain-containing protein n=1 Tax=Araneus ventricosus TaxID=182803 RepID=A0A4Y2SYX9_ARAVE|nr:hypothetical protein AVEN_269020-1 [Araneus ventricosus]